MSVPLGVYDLSVSLLILPVCVYAHCVRACLCVAPGPAFAPRRHGHLSISAVGTTSVSAHTSVPRWAHQGEMCVSVCLGLCACCCLWAPMARGCVSLCSSVYLSE